MRTLLLNVSLVFFTSLGFSNAFATNVVAGSAATKLMCSEVFSFEFQVSRPTLNHYITEGTKPSAGYKEPKFDSPKNEMEAAKTWNGISGPEALQSMLPTGASFLSDSLKGAAEPGVVKSTSGSMVHLRATIRKGRRTIGTNVGVNIGALRDNQFREAKSFVREKSEAVVIFLHGGGTTTTGHHVGASLLNWLSARNIDLISMDLDWHGMGPRESVRGVRDSLETIRALIQQYVPAGKKVIIAGHSMGGVLADQYMRIYPNDSLVSAVIPLSTVADSSPGSDVRQKMDLDDVIAAANKDNEKVPAEERNLGEKLASAGKLSPTCGFFCDVILYGMDWTIPKDQGRSFLPALYVIGEGDALYQGYQAIFDKYVRGLSNAKLFVLGKRRDLKEKDLNKKVDIGHMIFDHKPNVYFDESIPKDVQERILFGRVREWEYAGLQKFANEGKLNIETGYLDSTLQPDVIEIVKKKNFGPTEWEGLNSLVARGKIRMDPGIRVEDLSEPETFVLMKNFIETVVGKKLPKVKDETTPVELFLQSWANNLAFRKFAETYVYLHLKAEAKGVALGEEANRISSEMKSIQSRIKNGVGSAEEKANDQARLEVLNATRAKVFSILSNRGEPTARDLPRYQQLSKYQKEELQKPLADLNAKRLKIRDEISITRGQVNRSETYLLEHSDILHSESFDIAKAQKAFAFKRLMQLDSKVRELTREYLHKNWLGNRFVKGLFETLPSELSQAFSDFEAASAKYQEVIKHTDEVLLAESSAGRLTISATDSFSIEVRDQIISALDIVIRKKSELQNNLRESQILDQKISDLASKSYQIDLQLAELGGIEYFTPQLFTVNQLFAGTKESSSQSNSIQKKDENAAVMQKIWSEWSKLWSGRIVGEVTESVY